MADIVSFEGGILYRTEALIDDFMLMAHPWRQMHEADTRRSARRYLEKVGELRTREDLQGLIDIFDDPRKYDTPTRAVKQTDRAAVLAVGRCAVCGSPEDLQVDHKKPICRGGSNHRSNLQALCGQCNRSKGAKTMPEWMGR